MTTVLNYNIDLWLFIAISSLASVALALWLRRRYGESLLKRPLLPTAVLLIALAGFFSHRAGEGERSRLMQMVAGITPTYAIELDRLGHRQVGLDTAPDDPTYLRLIQAQRQWQEANRGVADIYTYVKRPDGQIALCVDSETDYNRDGTYADDEHEGRTAIGEVYDAPDAIAGIEVAFSGEPHFESEIVTDRWGTWVSANHPIRDEAGNVYAVVGVDFPAEQWLSGILSARRSFLIVGLVALSIQLCTSFMTAQLRSEVSRRREAEEAYRRSEARLRAIVDNEPECVMVLDPHGRITEINPAGARMLRLAQNTAIGTEIGPLVHTQHRDQFAAHLQVVACGESAVMEMQMALPADVVAGGEELSPLWLETHSVPLCDKAGAACGVLSVARDISARKIAAAEKEVLQRQLIDASRQAGMAEIATGVLHNVGNVLNSVNVSARIITDRLTASRLPSLGKLAELIQSQKHQLAHFVANDDRGKCLPEFVEQLHRRLAEDHAKLISEANDLQSGVEHIKEVVRMQQRCAAGQSSVVQPVLPHELMDEAVKVNLVSMERHLVHITREYDGTIGHLPLDRHKILQILINLVNNAKKATCHPSVAERRVTLRVQLVEGSVRFEVEDNGVGIEPANLPRIFRHGFTTRADGHGFGLHSSANAASEMRGTLVVHSDGPGCGARFTLTIPTRTIAEGKAAA